MSSSFSWKFNLLIGVLVAAVFSLSACSSTPDYKGVYDSDQDETSLEVPPDLNAPQPDSNQELPEQDDLVRTYSGYQQNVLSKPADSLLKTYDDMHFVRSGSLFWLEVDAPPQEVWGEVRDFFRKVGFQIENEQPALGLMETNWKENKVNVPSNWLASLFSFASSSGLRDKYRIRLEETDDKNKTRVFIAHQGMKEVEVNEEASSAADPVQTAWEPRPPDPDLEAEMLMRFMAYRGLSENKAKEKIAKAGPPQQQSEVKQSNEESVLEVYEPFARTWRHVGLALDRLGFYVEDRNRSAGVYYIRLPEDFTIEEDQGWLASVFGSDKKSPKNLKYLLVLKDQGEHTTVELRSRGDMKKEDLAKLSKAILEKIRQNIL
jgi:outer membrane protein assembly factor BamC